MHLKENFPFRIGCTSYVIPDDILSNVFFMADKVDDIELVLFEGKVHSNLPGNKVISELNTIAREHSLTYSVHLPIDQQVASENLSECDSFFSTVCRIVESTTKLPVSKYILHFEGINTLNPESDYERWHTRVETFSNKLSAQFNSDLSGFAVENLSYPIEFNEDIIQGHGFSRCIDIGHLWMQDFNWERYLSMYLSQCDVIHLHGVKSSNHDHSSLADHKNNSDIKKVSTYLMEFKGVVTIEVFKYDNFQTSLSLLRDLCRK